MTDLTAGDLVKTIRRISKELKKGLFVLLDDPANSEGAFLRLSRPGEDLETGSLFATDDVVTIHRDYIDNLEGLVGPNPYFIPPITLAGAVETIIEHWPADMVESIRETSEEDLISFHLSVGATFRNEFQLWENDELVKDCGVEHPDDAAMVILRAVWERLVP